MNLFNKTEKQMEAVELLSGPAKRVMLYGGSRSGKTAILIYCILVRAFKEKSRHVILRFRFNHVKTSIWYDTLPKIAGLMGVKGLIKENKSDWFYQLPNGSEIWIGGLDDKDRTEKILGNEYSTIYFNESSQIGYESVTIALTRLAENSGLANKAYFDCNPPSSKHWSYHLFVKHRDPKSRLSVNRMLYACMLMNPLHNQENLPEGYIEETLANLPERQRKRFLLGEWMEDIEGALWKNHWIERNRVDKLPDMVRIVVAVDPAVTSNEDSDETGIVVCGLDKEGHGYQLDDLTGVYTPDQWARKVTYAYEKWNADKVVAEVNQGGDLVESNIRTVNKNISYRAVRAYKGKYLRAEPIAALSEQDRIMFYGSSPELEEELTTWNAAAGDASPNRLDAMVYGFTELMINEQDANYWG